MTPAAAVTPAASNLRPVHLLCLILLAAAALRVYHIGYFSIWTDEIASLELSCGRPLGWSDLPADQLIRPGPGVTSLKNAAPTEAIWTALQQTAQEPPLYSVILRCWRAIFGETDAVARCLSMACALIAIFLLYDSVRLTEGPVPALWAAAIMALATPQIQFSQEVRSYMMLVMWTLAAINAALRMERLGVSVRRGMWLTLALLAGMMTHYYAVAGAVAIGVYALARLRGRPRRATVAAFNGAMVLFIVACGSLLWSQRTNFHNNMTWIADARQGLIGRTLWRVSVLPLMQLVNPMQRAMPLAPISAAFLMLPPLMFRRRPGLIIWWVLAIMAIGLPVMADLVNGSKSLEFVRYTLPAAPAIFAIAALVLSDRRGWLRHVIPAVVAAGCLIGLSDAYVQPLKVDRREFARQLDRQAGPDDVLVVYHASREDWYERALYAGLMHYLPQSTRPLLIVTKPIDQALKQELQAAPNVWLLAESSPPVDRFFPGAFSTRSVAMPFVGEAVTVQWPGATTSIAAPPKSPPSP